MSPEESRLKQAVVTYGIVCLLSLHALVNYRKGYRDAKNATEEDPSE